MPLPEKSPLQVPKAVCSQCAHELRIDVQTYGKGIVTGAIGYCDTCKYGWEFSMQYATGTHKEYKPAMAKEVPKFAPKTAKDAAKEPEKKA